MFYDEKIGMKITYPDLMTEMCVLNILEKVIVSGFYISRLHNSTLQVCLCP